MLTSVYSITVHVRDQAAAVKYYTEKLGFEVKNDKPMPGDHRWIEVAVPAADGGDATIPAWNRR